MTGSPPQEMIRNKRDGIALTEDEIRGFMAGVTDGSLPDYQIAAMLMAVFFRGLDDAELAVWADAMTRSGEVLDLSRIARPKLDKHSTGGVGDKISLPLAPAVAACGVAVPMISGRGLGHTGGTLDKLESIPGFTVRLDIETFIAQVDRIGVALIGQTDTLAPADRRLYALRDVTGTVESIPLIASSIMSKKLAEGIDGLVLDCKVGDGAFMKTLADARALAAAIRVIGSSAGVRVTAVLTDMDAPIGEAVGHALEVAESIAVLRGGGPADTRELTVRLGAEMLLMSGISGVSDERTAAHAIEGALDSGRALEVFRQVVEAQGGDPRVCDDPESVLPRARKRDAVVAERAGVVTRIGARDVGMAALALGAGRVRVEDAIDHAVGVLVCVRVGDRVEPGQELARIVHNGRGVDQARERLARAFAIAAPGDAGGADTPAERTRILEVMR